MPRYRVQNRYYSEHNGRRFGPYKAGSEVELEERDAAWVNRDCPGTLQTLGGERPSRSEWKAPEPPLTSAEKSTAVDAPRRRARSAGKGKGA